MASNYQSLNLDEAGIQGTEPAFDPQTLKHGTAFHLGSNGSNPRSLLLPLRRSAYTENLSEQPSPPFYSLSKIRSLRTQLFAGFEAPNWRQILLHTVLCLMSYPILLVAAVVANNKSIFWARFIVALGCGLVGLCLGYSLLNLAKRHLEAATWATVIHQSHSDDSPGVRLRDLAATTESPTSAWSALFLLWNRMMHPATSRRSRQNYDPRLWSLFIIGFLLLILVAGTMSFFLGRLINIDSDLTRQLELYEEISVKGVNSDADIARASLLRPTFDNYTLTWTMAPFSSHGGLPPVVSFPWENDTIYFSETIMSQLLPNGSGFGTFDTETMNPSLKTDPSVKSDNVAVEVLPGSVLRFPKWGIRIRCTKLPDLYVNLVPVSNNHNMTYLFTPQSVLVSLFSAFGMEYPESSIGPFNITNVVELGDTVSEALNTDNIALGARFDNNGVGHSYFSKPASLGADGKGWISIEEVVVRLNTSYTPNGTFALLGDQSMPDSQGNPTWIGYDAAICVELFEPWIVEVYNSTTGRPTTLKIVEPGNVVRSQDTPELQEKLIGLPLSLTDSGASQQLNSSKLTDVYIDAHQNSVNQVLKDNDRDMWYVTSPTVISYTDGEGPRGYTELSPSRFAQARAMADATNLLPYFAGRGTILARRYQDLVLSNTFINKLYMGVYLSLIFLLGLFAGFFVPKLPFDVPHRGFEVYSWMAAFYADELMEVGRSPGIERNLELHEIAQQVDDVRFRYMGLDTPLSHR